MPRGGLRLATALALLAACKTDIAIGPQGVASVTVSPPSDSLAVGDSLHLVAVAVTPGGQSYVGAPTTWSSDNPSVATVSASGVVFGVGPGAVTITAASGGKQGTAQLKVGRPTITLAPTTL